ncbi:hypothetical protein ACFVX3_31390 [Rhodococcus erythropolis]
MWMGNATTHEVGPSSEQRSPTTYARLRVHVDLHRRLPRQEIYPQRVDGVRTRAAMLVPRAPPRIARLADGLGDPGLSATASRR